MREHNLTPPYAAGTEVDPHNIQYVFQALQRAHELALRVENVVTSVAGAFTVPAAGTSNGIAAGKQDGVIPALIEHAMYVSAAFDHAHDALSHLERRVM